MATVMRSRFDGYTCDKCGKEHLGRDQRCEVSVVVWDRGTKLKESRSFHFCGECLESRHASTLLL
jgi:hypothetical protein